MARIEPTAAGMVLRNSGRSMVVRWPVIARTVRRHLLRESEWFKTDGIAIRVRIGVAEFRTVRQRFLIDVESLQFALAARK
jgi:hypothetical protein